MQTNTPPPPRFLRLPEVQHQVGLGRSAIYTRIKTGAFPAPLKLSARLAVWPASVIDAWITQQIAASKVSV